MSRISLTAERYRPIVFFTGLSLLFLLSFSLPILFVSQGVSLFLGSGGSVEPTRRFFDKAIRVGAQGQYVKVAHSPDLQPVSGGDFLVFGWFKLARLPEPGQRTILLSKVSGGEDKYGYSVGLLNDNGEIHPVVYWRDRNRSTKGGTYYFRDTDVQPGQWFLITATYRQGRYLGVHLWVRREDQAEGDVELKGGVDLVEPTLPLTDADLIVGSWGQNPFRGEIGPFGIISAQDFTSELVKVLKLLVRSKETIPDGLPLDTISLWVANGTSDLSGKKHLIEEVGAPKIRARRSDNDAAGDSEEGAVATP